MQASMEPTGPPRPSVATTRARKRLLKRTPRQLLAQNHTLLNLHNVRIRAYFALCRMPLRASRGLAKCRDGRAVNTAKTDCVQRHTQQASSM